MNTSLEVLMREKGDLAFPHAHETGEELLELFRAGRTDGTVATGRLVELLRGDPGFAFNFARVLREEGAPLGDGRPAELVERLNRHGAFRIVAILASQELHADAFGAHHRLATAFRLVAAAAGQAARKASAEVPAEWADTAILMAVNSALPLLGIANLAPERALPILLATSSASEACHDLGFSLEEFGQALIDRYRLPDASNIAYPSEVRDAVLAAMAEVNLAAAVRAPRSRTRPVRAA